MIEPWFDAIDCSHPELLHLLVYVTYDVEW